MKKLLKKLYIEKICFLSLFITWNVFSMGQTSSKNFSQIPNFRNMSIPDSIPAHLPTRQIPKELLPDAETVRLMKLENAIPFLYDLEAEIYARFCPRKPMTNYTELITELRLQLKEQEEIMKKYKKGTKEHVILQDNLRKLETAITDAGKLIETERIQSINSSVITATTNIQDIKTLNESQVTSISAASAAAAAAATSISTNAKDPNAKTLDESQGKMVASAAAATSISSNTKTNTKTANEPFGNAQEKSLINMSTTAATRPASPMKQQDPNEVVDNLIGIMKSSDITMSSHDKSIAITKLKNLVSQLE